MIEEEPLKRCPHCGCQKFVRQDANIPFLGIQRMVVCKGCGSSSLNAKKWNQRVDDAVQ